MKKLFIASALCAGLLVSVPGCSHYAGADTDTPKSAQKTSAPAEKKSDVIEAQELSTDSTSVYYYKVKLPDGRTVFCIVAAQIQGASCDWDSATKQ